MLSEFRAFMVKTNALALAIGVIIGAALGAVVTSLVEDIIMPPVGLLLGGVDFAALALNLNADGSVRIRYGEFVNAIIAFLAIALVVFWISKAFIKPAPEPEPVAMRSCPYCLEQVPAAATKCKACASTL